jgi:predicted RNase H-like HicB family nuclease
MSWRGWGDGINHRIRRETSVTTYTFKVVVEPDEDRWRAYCPALEDQGAATWGYTRDEALQHIREVLEMIVAEFIEEGKPVPGNVAVSDEPLVAVTV